MRAHPFAVLALVLSACAPEKTASSPSASAGTCAGEKSPPPSLPPSLAPPEGAHRVIARASATGTQAYRCAPSSPEGGGAFGWTFLGPEAALTGCDGAPLGRHYASEGGAAAPEWQALDGSFVVGKKVASEAAAEPGAVPWLLLQVTGSGGSGALNGVAYVQRTATKGGVAPTDGCDAARAGAVVKVPYSAEYWFLGR